MRKAEFMHILQRNVLLLPVEERNELLADYEAHFEFGKQNGKSEEEIARELGNPIELANEILADRKLEFPDFQPFEKNLGYTERQDFPEKVHASRSAVKTVFIFIGLFFLNIIFLPLSIAAFALTFAITVIPIICLASPLALFADYLINHNFYLYKVFVCVAAVGIGILLSLVIKPMWQGVIRVFIKYLRWNSRVLKGRG